MSYTLLTSKGSIKQFYVREMAELYQSIYGGVILDVVILQQSMETA
jgi:hypothetical protein